MSKIDVLMVGETQNTSRCKNNNKSNDDDDDTSVYTTPKQTKAKQKEEMIVQQEQIESRFSCTDMHSIYFFLPLAFPADDDDDDEDEAAERKKCSSGLATGCVAPFFPPPSLPPPAPFRFAFLLAPGGCESFRRSFSLSSFSSSSFSRLLKCGSDALRQLSTCWLNSCKPTDRRRAHKGHE